MTKDSIFPDEIFDISPEEYLNHVRSLPCLIGGGAADPHHLKAVGAGRKRSRPKWEDYTVVPLGRKYHREVEQIGLKKFEEKHKIDLFRSALLILANWIFDKQKTYERLNDGKRN